MRSRMAMSKRSKKQEEHAGNMRVTLTEKGMAATATAPATDPVSHPSHYTSHPSGVECITITEHLGFNVGNAIKYLWRAGLKSPDALTDLRKAKQCIEFELARLQRPPVRP